MSYYFDGSTFTRVYDDAGPSINWGANSVSIAFWFKPDNTSAERTMLEVTGSYQILVYHNSSGNLVARVKSGSGGDTTTTTSHTASTGAWNHAVLVLTPGSATRHTLYLNYGAGGNSPATSTAAINTTGANATWNFGCYQWGSYFIGNIAEAAAYDGELSSAQVTSLYTTYADAVAGTPTKLAYWKMNGTTDETGNGHTLATTGSGVTLAAGVNPTLSSGASAVVLPHQRNSTNSSRQLILNGLGRKPY